MPTSDLLVSTRGAGPDNRRLDHRGPNQHVIVPNVAAARTCKYVNYTHMETSTPWNSAGFVYSYGPLLQENYCISPYQGGSNPYAIELLFASIETSLSTGEMRFHADTAFGSSGTPC